MNRRLPNSTKPPPHASHKRRAAANRVPRFRRVSRIPACFQPEHSSTSLRSAIVTVAALLTAACGDGGTAPEPNRPPVASGTIPAQTVAVGESETVSVASAFSDPDGDALSYSATSSASDVASVAVSGANVTITGVSAGTANVTVTASDPGGFSGQQVFETTVTGGACRVGQVLSPGDSCTVGSDTFQVLADGSGRYGCCITAGQGITINTFRAVRISNTNNWRIESI